MFFTEVRLLLVVVVDVWHKFDGTERDVEEEEEDVEDLEWRPVGWNNDTPPGERGSVLLYTPLLSATMLFRRGSCCCCCSFSCCCVCLINACVKPLVPVLRLLRLDPDDARSRFSALCVDRSMSAARIGGSELSCMVMVWCGAAFFSSFKKNSQCWKMLEECMWSTVWRCVQDENRFFRKHSSILQY